MQFPVPSLHVKLNFSSFYNDVDDFGSLFWDRILSFVHSRRLPFSEHDFYKSLLYLLMVSSFGEREATRILLGNYNGLSTFNVFRIIVISFFVYRFRHRLYRDLVTDFHVISDILEA